MIGTLLGLALLPVVIACGPDERTEAALQDLTAQVAELNRQVTDAHVRIEDLSNRVFLIQQQITAISEQAAGQPPRRLPVVKLVPNKAPTPPPNAQQLTSTPQEDTNQEDSQPPILISNWQTDDGAQAGSAEASAQAAQINREAAIAQEYEAALALYREGSYNPAIEAFAAFLKRWPENDYTDNAVFWTGMALFEQKEYDLAMVEFDRVLMIRKTNKAPDAMYYKALALKRKGRKSDANDLFRALIARFPKHEAATRAQNEIE